MKQFYFSTFYIFNTIYYPLIIPEAYQFLFFHLLTQQSHHLSGCHAIGVNSLSIVCFKLKTNLNRIKKYVKIKIFYDIVMSDKDPQITKFNNEHHKYEKEAPITFADCEFLIKNLDG